VFSPLAVFTFLGYKYWKTRISIDAVEKFLQMQQTLSPTRYAYTDITAITGHFREKLGQGGYGSVYKGALFGDVFVAVKMLAEGPKRATRGGKWEPIQNSRNRKLGLRSKVCTQP